ncbi:MAG: hypothetical protein ACYC61_18440 [Isosphaeraceae bacterium]
MRVSVVLHERLGNWNRQLRPRLVRQPVRWFESRSGAELAEVIAGIAAPVVLIDLARRPLEGLAALEVVGSRVPGARTLVLDPESTPGIAGLARELGATQVVSGFVPPPEVAGWLERWIALAGRDLERAGWSRATPSDATTEPWGWLSEYLDQSAALR